MVRTYFTKLAIELQMNKISLPHFLISHQKQEILTLSYDLALVSSVYEPLSRQPTFTTCQIIQIQTQNKK